MNNWEDFIWLITNPYMIALFLFALALEPIMKYLRRFYPESHKKAVEKSENFNKELLNNKEDKKLYNKANMKIGLFIFGPTFLLFTISITYNYFMGEELKLQCIIKEFGKFAYIFIMTLGFYAIKMDVIHRLLFKDDYQKVMEFSYKQSGNDPLMKYYEKYAPIFGYLILLFGIFGFIYMLFFDK